MRSRLSKASVKPLLTRWQATQFSQKRSDAKARMRWARKLSLWQSAR